MRHIIKKFFAKMTLLPVRSRQPILSKRGVIRGLHLQLKPYVQAKLIGAAR
jgi:dTDP-4-dehydrorhamnose 3,5-epimerase-like enzyme